MRILLLRRLTATTTGIATVTAAATAAFAGAFMEFFAAAARILVLPRTLSLRPSAAGLGTATAGILPLVHRTALRFRRAGTVARCQGNFKFIEFIPLGVGAIAVRNGQQFLHPRPGRNGGLWGL